MDSDPARGNSNHARPAQQVAGVNMDHRDASRHPRLFSEERHDASEDMPERGGPGALVLKWRQKEKLKTTAAALVLCLNIGVDPPDVIKISPCARLECWVDPLSMQPAKALETIGKNLQAQYERWQPKAKFKMHLDPTVEDVKKLAQSSRRAAKTERVLFHYNGHGVPRPTANGELWVFNARYTQYIPLSLFELQNWLGTPAIYVLDCSAAGQVIDTFKSYADPRAAGAQTYPGGPVPPGVTLDPMRDSIVLAACGAKESLPQSPELPADVFTACLTTPIKVALRWFASRSLLKHDGITKELIDRIPGRQTDRKTPLGELNWIFTAITDTVAWNVLPRALFQKLFRSDLLVASLFRNFLLAERIMTAAGCSPISMPRLPPTHQHPMWQAWDMAAEMCLMQLPTLLSDTSAEFQPSPFFSEQLTAFELWLAAGSRERSPPEQLPIVLQVLLSQVHRLRALVLLGRFLDMGPWAIDLALSVGIFPYVLKLLQTTSQDLRATLVFIWAKILALDKSCQVDLIKDNGDIYFIRFLDSSETGTDAVSRAQATFVLSAICDGHAKGQEACYKHGLLAVLLRWMKSFFPPQVAYPSPGHVLLLKWLCLCLGKLCQDAPEISLSAIRDGAADLLVALLTVAQAEIRAAAVYGLGCLVHAPPHTAGDSQNQSVASPLEDRLPAEQLIANAVRQVVYDPSVLVRCELAVLYSRYVRGHATLVQDALVLAQRKLLNEFGRHHLSPHSTNSATPQRSIDELHPDDFGRMARAESAGPALGSSAHDGGAASFDHSQHAGGARAVSAIYTSMVESIQLLALDPSPKVTKLGRQVLRAAQCELHFVATAVLPAAAASHAANSPHSSAGSAISSFTQKLRRPGGWGSSVPPTGRSGPGTPNQLGNTYGSPLYNQGPQTAGCMDTAGSMGLGSNVGAASRSSSPTSPSRDQMFCRPPYVLRARTAETDSWSAAHSGYDPNRPTSSHTLGMPPSSPSSQQAQVHGATRFASVGQAQMSPREAASMGLTLGQQAAMPMEPLPPSRVYKLSADQFARPTLEPGATAWREPGAPGSLQAYWAGPPDLKRRRERLEAISRELLRTRSLTQPKLREQVYSVDTQGEGLAQVAFHPYHPLLVCVDQLGFVRVVPYDAAPNANPKPIHSFHVSNGAPPSDTRVLPATITHCQHICEADGPLLLTGAADGAVRIWRQHAVVGGVPRMATSMQAVTILLPPSLGRPASYAWNGSRCHLFAAGGSHPDMVYCWDMMHEMCSSMIPTSGSTGAGGTGPSVDRLLLGVADPNLLLASCSDYTIRLFDVRSPRGPVMVLQPFRSMVSGVALEPAGRPGIIVAASEKGELVLLDSRAAHGATAAAIQYNNPPPGMAELSAMACTKVVAAHSKGGVSTLVAHPVAPLLATGTTNHVVKVWTDQCEVVGAIRSHSSTSQKASAVSMAWHPYQALLAAGGQDGIATVYVVDQTQHRAG